MTTDYIRKAQCVLALHNCSQAAALINYERLMARSFRMAVIGRRADAHGNKLVAEAWKTVAGINSKELQPQAMQAGHQA